MSKVIYIINPTGIVELGNKKIVSIYAGAKGVIVARYGVNKTTLKKILAKGA